jgi:hypothetical protein
MEALARIHRSRWRSSWSELSKALKVLRSLPADNLKPSIFRFLIAASLVTPVSRQGPRPEPRS